MNTTDVLPLAAQATLEYYEQRAADLLYACLSPDQDTVKYIQKYHPAAWQFSALNNSNSSFTIEDAQLTIAREHGFENYALLSHHLAELRDESSPISQFERAADAIVRGDCIALKQLLEENSWLISQRSSRGHQATLLHYLAANGTETFRQECPVNAVDVAELLLSRGAVPDATSEIYEQNWCTTLDLLVSSVHPAKAGVQAALVAKLADYGAAPNGVLNDGSPLLTAICFRYKEAAEVLISRGARIDNIVTAAAMGRTAQVAEMLDAGGKLCEPAKLMNVPWAPGIKTAEDNVSLALVWAAMLDRPEIVDLLLKRQVNPSARDHRNWTALHWAAYYGYPETFRILLDGKAPLEARNEFGGTVLDQVIWATTFEGVGEHHPGIISKLLEAGAKVHPWWFFDNLAQPLDRRVLALLEAGQSK